jgi:Tellurite resistance protein TerB.
MKFIEKLFGKAPSSSLHPSLTQPEREAIIDLLLLAAYADNHLSFNESREFDEATESLGWESSTGISVYLSNATDRARNARGNVTPFIEFVAERLNSPAAKDRALELLNRLFIADGKDEKEQAFFKQVEAVFAG